MAVRKRKQGSKQKIKRSANTNNPETNGTTRDYIILYVTLIGALLFSCLCTAAIWYVFIRDKLPLEYVTVHPIGVVTVSPDLSFVEDVIRKGKPVIIRDSLITKWPAYKKWSPEYLAKKQRNIFGVYENNNKWFGPYYEQDKPMGEFTTKINKYKTNVTLTTKDFINQLHKPDPNKYIYYTNNIEELGDWAINDVIPYSELIAPNPAHSSINVWIGQSNVIAHCHYDGYHNFYAQLYGRKKFTLFSPTSYQGLYPYPFLHPSHAQAQVNLSNYEDVELFPLVKDLKSFEATLSPGDLLYIPPLWYHHVQAMDVSMSVNVWTDTEQSIIMEKVFQTILPINEVKWNGHHLKAIGSSVILHRLLEAVCTKMNCSHGSSHADSTINKPDHWYLMNRLWNSRYRTLMERNVLYSRFVLDGNRHRKSLICENDFLPDLFYEGIAQKIGKTSVKRFVAVVSELLIQLPHDTWETWFSNYIEYVAYNAVPDVKYIGIFIKHYDSCIQYF